MDKLIQTGVASIIYGTFNGKENQELFRCPRELDDKDLVRYINEHRSLVGFVNNDEVEDLHEVKDKRLINYYRMYYRDGWDGRWMGDTKVDRADCKGVQDIVNWFVENFEKGCDYYMKDYFKENFKQWGDDTRYLIKPKYSERFKVMVDTKYNNGDYPVRIYVYESEVD